MVDRFTSFCAYLVSLSTLFIALSSAMNLFFPEKEGDVNVGLSVSLAVTFGIIAFFSGRKAWNYQQLAKDKEKALLEKHILCVIEKHQGRVTPEDISIATCLTVQQAVQHLNKLCQEGSGGQELTEQGKVLYAFHGFISPEEKQTSKSVI